MATPRQTAVINTNTGNVRDVLYVSAGKLYIDGDVLTNATNLGLTEAIPWNNIKSITKTTAQSGAQKVVQINFDSAIHSLTAGDKLEMLIKSAYKVDNKPFRLPITVYCGAATQSLTIAEVVTLQFYALLNNSAYPFTVAKSGTTGLIITGAFGNVDTTVEDFEVVMPWVSADASPKTITGIADSGGTKCTITSNAHGLSNGDIVKITDVTWTAEPTAGDFDPNKGYVVSEKTTNTFKVVHVFTGATYGSGGTVEEVAQGNTTEYSKPYGTGEIADLYAPDNAVLSNTYFTYDIEYTIPLTGTLGLDGLKTVHAFVFVKNTLTEVVSVLDAIAAGARLPVSEIDGITKANPGVCTTTTPHGLAVGDVITMNAAVVNPTDFNGKIFTVTKVESATTFEFGFDASGITNAETGGYVRLLNPEKDYLAK